MSDVPLFQFLDAITDNKKDLLREGVLRSDQYDKFRINRGLSLYLDCVLFADEMNNSSDLPKDMQYDYLMATVKPRRRSKAKWPKQIESEETQALSRWFGISRRRAEEARTVLRREDVETITRKVRIITDD